MLFEEEYLVLTIAHLIKILMVRILFSILILKIVKNWLMTVIHLVSQFSIIADLNKEYINLLMEDVYSIKIPFKDINESLIYTSYKFNLLLLIS